MNSNPNYYKQDERITPPRDWKKYNASQKTEKAMFLSLLAELCDGIEEPTQTMGRPKASLRDAIFSITLKAYTMLSARRNNCDIEDAYENGFIEKPLAYNTILKFFQNEQVPHILKDMIQTSARALTEVESDFAFDSTGFSTAVYRSWESVKYGKTKEAKDWVKLHCCVGVKTGIITSFEISQLGDAGMFKPLFDSTRANGFDVKRVFADKAYNTHNNLKLVVGNYVEPYIRFKNDSKFSDTDSVWNHLLHFYSANKTAFYRHYHLRSNVEAVFSSAKRKFGRKLLSKTEEAQTVEVMAKILAYNLTVVIRSLFELDIEPNFKRDRLEAEM